MSIRFLPWTKYSKTVKRHWLNMLQPVPFLYPRAFGDNEGHDVFTCPIFTRQDSGIGVS